MTEIAHRPPLSFRPIDLDAHLDVCLHFRIDTFVCVYGSGDRFLQLNGGGDGYVQWLRDKHAQLPGCLVHVWHDEQIVGQIEMGRLKNDASIGYVNLFYLIPEMRGQGLGALLEAYAWAFLSGLGCRSLRLSARPDSRQTLFPAAARRSATGGMHRHQTRRDSGSWIRHRLLGEPRPRQPWIDERGVGCAGIQAVGAHAAIDGILCQHPQSEAG